MEPLHSLVTLTLATFTFIVSISMPSSNRQDNTHTAPKACTLMRTSSVMHANTHTAHTLARRAMHTHALMRDGSMMLANHLSMTLSNERIAVQQAN